MCVAVSVCVCVSVQMEYTSFLCRIRWLGYVERICEPKTLQCVRGCVCVQENTVLLCVAFVRVENASVCVSLCVCVSAKGIHLLFVSHSLV